MATATMAKTTNQTIADLQAEVAKLRAVAEKQHVISMKVSEKGALSLYGMGRFPVTLYKEQWLRVLEHSDKIQAFIEANNGKLKNKGDE